MPPIGDGPTLGTENITTTNPPDPKRPDLVKSGNPLAGSGDSRITTHTKGAKSEGKSPGGKAGSFPGQNPRGYSYMQQAGEGAALKSANVAPDGTRRVSKL